MLESAREYQEIVDREVEKLKLKLGKNIKHNYTGECPYCGRHGVFDIKGLGHHFPANNSIYYSTVWNEWHCEDCEMHRVE